MKTSKKNLILGAVVAANVVLSGSFYLIQKNIDHETRDYQVKVMAVEKKIDKLAETSKGDLLAKAKKGSNTEKENAEQYQNEAIATRYTQELFNVLMTFNSSEEYAARAEKLKYMLSPEVLEDKRLFGSDKDNTGQGAIDVLQLRSRFESIQSYCFSEDDNQITVMSEVRFSASKAGYQAGRNIVIYLSKFDTAKKQFTEVNKLGKLDVKVD